MITGFRPVLGVGKVLVGPQGVPDRLNSPKPHFLREIAAAHDHPSARLYAVIGESDYNNIGSVS